MSTKQMNMSRLELDIASSYIMTLYGNSTQNIINYIKCNIDKSDFINSDNEFQLSMQHNKKNILHLNLSVIKNTKKTENLIFEIFYFKGNDKHGKPIIFDGENYYPARLINSDIFRKFHNTIVGVCMTPRSIDAHWIYVDENGYIHNSYNNGLQLDGSDQFCQSYALLMALSPYHRNAFTNNPNGVKLGYDELLKLWKLTLYYIVHNSMETNIMSRKTFHQYTLEEVLDVNMMEDRQIINKIINNYSNKNSFSVANYVFNIMNSNYAKLNAPFFM